PAPVPPGAVRVIVGLTAASVDCPVCTSGSSPCDSSVWDSRRNGGRRSHLLLSRENARLSRELTALARTPSIAVRRSTSLPGAPPAGDRIPFAALLVATLIF